MNKETLEALYAVQSLVGQRYVVASVPYLDKPVISTDLILLSKHPDKREGWYAAFDFMIERNIITSSQQNILNDAFQVGSPLYKETEKRVLAEGNGHLLHDKNWQQHEVQKWGFIYYMEDQHPPQNIVSKIFESAKQLLYRLRHLVMLAGYESAEDVFAHIKNGGAAKAHERQILATPKSYQVKLFSVYEGENEIKDKLLGVYCVESTSDLEAKNAATIQFEREWRKNNRCAAPLVEAEVSVINPFKARHTTKPTRDTGDELFFDPLDAPAP